MAGAKRNAKRRRAAARADDPASARDAPGEPKTGEKAAAHDADTAGDKRRAPPPVVRSGWTRRGYALMAIAVFYLGTVWLDGIGSRAPSAWLPRPWVYFAQVAALFKRSGLMAIDYRAEGWVCSDKKWVEVDVRPFFRVDQDNKENRFHRTLQFYRRDRTVMRALEAFVIQSVNGSSNTRIGGVRFLSLRIPYPKPGEHVAAYERKPLSAYPAEMRKAWYWTPRSKRIEACGSDVPPDVDQEGRSVADDEKKVPAGDPSKEPEQ